MKTTKAQRAEWLRLVEDVKGREQAIAGIPFYDVLLEEMLDRLEAAARNALRPLIEDVEELEQEYARLMKRCMDAEWAERQYRETNARLNRRCQQAEAQVARLRNDMPWGRLLERRDKENEELKKEVERLKEKLSAWMLED